MLEQLEIRGQFSLMGCSQLGRATTSHSLGSATRHEAFTFSSFLRVPVKYSAFYLNVPLLLVERASIVFFVSRSADSGAISFRLLLQYL